MKTFAVTAEQVNQYQTDGYGIFRSVLDAGLIREASDHVEWLRRKHPDIPPENLGHELMLDDPFRLRLVSDGRLLDIAEALLGPNIALFASDYICKPPGVGRAVLWHQDAFYWHLEPMEVITAWVAVDDSKKENGCLRVIPGSHRERRLFSHLHTNTAAVLSTHISQAEVDETKAVDIELKAGDVSVHNPFLIHGSNPNRSSRRRCGATIQYIPTSTKLTNVPAETQVSGEWRMFLLRGTDTYHKNVYQPWPKYREGDHFPFRASSTYGAGIAER